MQHGDMTTKSKMKSPKSTTLKSVRFKRQLARRRLSGSILAVQDDGPSCWPQSLLKSGNAMATNGRRKHWKRSPPHFEQTTTNWHIWRRNEEHRRRKHRFKF